MGSSKPKQSGFSIVEGVIAVFVIGILGFIGWTVYKNYFGKPSPKLTSQTTSQNNGISQPATNNNQPAQTIDPNAGYFVIKEWGVRIKEIGDLTDLQYKLKVAPDDSSISYANFYTPELASLVPQCNPLTGNQSLGLGSISRYPKSGQQPITGTYSIASFNDYSYYFGIDQYECLIPTSNNATAVSLFNKDKSEFYNAVKTIEDAKGIYLDIKEFGIKILLNSSINDAVYATYRTPSTDGSMIVGLSTQSLIDKDQQSESKPYCTAANGAIGIIVETTNPIVATPAGNQTLTPDGKTTFKIGDIYYRYIKPQNEGCGVNQATDDLENTKTNAIQQAFTTLQPDN